MPSYPKEMNTTTRLIAVAGQTASGKNELALMLAKNFNGIIVNADSRQIYRDLNIGTAKPIPDKIKKDGTWIIDTIPHYLYGFASLETEYNIYKYQKDVEKILNKNEGKVIFLVGGTGLYIDSIVLGYNLPQTIETSYSNLEFDKLVEKVGSRFENLSESDKKNRRRLESIARQIDLPSQNASTNSLYLVLDLPKEVIKERISKRVENMFVSGLEEENRNLFEKYKGFELNSLQTIGYKEFEEYFKGNIPIETVKELIITHTNQYAKRQKTWFKRNQNALLVSDYNSAYLAVSNFLSTFN